LTRAPLPFPTRRSSDLGNDLVFESLPLLRRANHLNFIGNVEGRDVFRDTCDVVVTDGFTGNVVLKTAESVAGLLFQRIRSEVAGDRKSTRLNSSHGSIS